MAALISGTRARSTLSVSTACVASRRRFSRVTNIVSCFTDSRIPRAQSRNSIAVVDSRESSPPGGARAIDSTSTFSTIASGSNGTVRWYSRFSDAATSRFTASAAMVYRRRTSASSAQCVSRTREEEEAVDGDDAFGCHRL